MKASWKRYIDMVDTKCPLAWKGIRVTNTGKVSPCCVMADELSYQPSPGETLKDMYNNEFFVNIRKEMLNGNKPKECAVCWESESMNGNGHSHRTKELQNATWQYNPIDYTQIEDCVPALWDVRTIQCNLKCQTCSPWHSSALIPIFNRVYGYESPILASLKTHDPSTRYDELINGLREGDVRVVQIAGGEPLMSKDVWRVLDVIRTLGQIPLHVSLCTNGTIMEKDGIKFLDVIRDYQGFGGATIIFSLDGVGDTFNFQRDGAKWEQVLQNFHQVHEVVAQNPRLNHHIQTVLTLPVLWDMGAQVNWINSLGKSVQWTPLEFKKSAWSAKGFWHDRNLLDVRCFPKPLSDMICDRALSQLEGMTHTRVPWAVNIIRGYRDNNKHHLFDANTLRLWKEQTERRLALVEDTTWLVRFRGECPEFFEWYDSI